MTITAIRGNPGLDTRNDDYMTLTWAGLDAVVNYDKGSRESFVAFADRSVQVYGGITNDSQLIIEGSNDGEVWHPLKNPFKEDLIFGVGGGLQTIIDVCQFVRPRIQGTAGSHATVVMCLRF